MNFNGVFDDWNYKNFSSLEEYLSWEKHILEVDEAKAWIYKPQFMDYVVRGMRNFLKSPFSDS